MNRKQLRWLPKPTLQMRKPNMPGPRAITETIEELRFYLAHSMAEQARVVFAKLEKLKPGAAQLAAVWQEIEAAEAQAGSKQPEAVEEVSVEEADEIPSAPEIESAFPATRNRVRGRICSGSSPAAAEEFKLPVRPMVPAPEPAVAEYAQASGGVRRGVLGEFVSDLEASLGDGFLPPAPCRPHRQCKLELLASRSQRLHHMPPRLQRRPLRLQFRLQLRPWKLRRRLSPISRPRSGHSLPKSRPQRRKRTPPAWIWPTCSAS